MDFCHIDERDENGCTPLLKAIFNHDVKLCSELVRLGADLSIPAESEYGVENTYLSYICSGYTFFTDTGQLASIKLEIYDLLNLLLFNSFREFVK